jgi:hypothetical protein
MPGWTAHAVSERSSTGRFEANSCKPTPGGLLPSLVQHHELSLVFVTHCKRLFGRIFFVPCVIASVHGPLDALQRRVQLFDVMPVWFRLRRVRD